MWTSCLERVRTLRESRCWRYVVPVFGAPMCRWTTRLMPPVVAPPLVEEVAQRPSRNPVTEAAFVAWFRDRPDGPPQPAEAERLGEDPDDERPVGGCACGVDGAHAHLTRAGGVEDEHADDGVVG